MSHVPQDAALSRFIGRLGALIRSSTAAGFEPYFWPVAISWALGASYSAVVPSWPAALSAKYGGAVIVLLCLLGTLAATFAVHTWRKRHEPEVRFLATSTWLGRRLCALLSLPLLLSLSGRLEHKHPFQVVAYSLVVGICFAVSAYQLSARRVLARGHTSGGGSEPVTGLARWGAPGALGALWLGYTTLFSTLSINNHLSFNTGRADLGFYVSIFRRSSIGDPLGCTLCGGGNHLSGHFDPLLVLFSPAFWIWPTAQMTLILQSAWLGSSLFPLYLLCRRFGLSRVQGVLLGVSFCAFPALHGVNLFDFHSLALVVPIALWMLWAVEAEKAGWYLGFLALLLLAREDAALLAVFVGAFVMMSGRKRGPLLGAATIVGALAYFMFVKLALMQGADPLNPHTGKGYAYYYSGLVQKGAGTPGLVATVMSDPERLLKVVFTEKKVLFLLQLFSPLCFLPLFAHRGKVTLLYGIAFTMLASRTFVPSLHFHYTSVIIPFLFMTTAVALGRLRSAPLFGSAGRALSLAASVGILASSLPMSWKFGGVVPNKSFRAGFKGLERRPSAKQIEISRALDDFCRDFPNDRAVAADGRYLPHLARCHTIIEKKKRKRADTLIWRMGKGGTSRKLRREIKKGWVKEERELVHGLKVYSLDYSKRKTTKKKKKKKKPKGDPSPKQADKKPPQGEAKGETKKKKPPKSEPKP